MDANSVSIDCPAGKSWVHVVISGRPTGEPYRKRLMDALDLLAENGRTSWLSDMSNGRAMDDADEDWSTEVWLPRAIQLGVAKMAVIQSTNIFSKMQAQRWERNPVDLWVNMPYELRIFSKKADAISWLEGAEAQNSILPGF